MKAKQELVAKKLRYSGRYFALQMRITALASERRLEKLGKISDKESGSWLPSAKTKTVRFGGLRHANQHIRLLQGDTKASPPAVAEVEKATECKPSARSRQHNKRQGAKLSYASLDGKTHLAGNKMLDVVARNHILCHRIENISGRWRLEVVCCCPSPVPIERRLCSGDSKSTFPSLIACWFLFF